MANRKIDDKDYALKLQRIFLDNYFENAKIKLDDNLKKRISNYYHWTALRTATFLLMGTYYSPQRAKDLLTELSSSYTELIKVFK